MLAIVLVLGLVVLAGDAVVGPPRPHTGPPSNVPLAVVSLGDSTISGEGAGDYQTGTDGQNGDWCHRSTKAEVNNVRLPGVTKQINLACSGADTVDVQLGNATHDTETSQAAKLGTLARHYRVTAVFIAIGANDNPEFSDLINQCVNAWADSGSCTDGFTPTWQKRVNAMVPKVVKTLRDIRLAMAGAGYQTSDYELVLQSYAAPIGPDVASSLRSLAGCPFRPNDLTWVRQTGVTVLDAGLRRAAEQAGTRFLDLARAGIGHEACSGGSNTASEWFTRLDVVWPDLQSDTRASHALQQSFHPNATGYAKFGGCLAAFLATTDQAAACLPGPDGSLHPAAEAINPP